MSTMIRSTWLRSVLLFALVLSASNCGDESEVIIEELDCALEGFEGGTYIFSVNSVGDGCTPGLIAGEVITPGDLFGPVALPGTAECPLKETSRTLPLVGTVPVNIFIEGDFIKIQGTEQIDVFIPEIGSTITATVSGTLCPVSANRVDGQITVRILSPSIPILMPTTPCNVTVLCHGHASVEGNSTDKETVNAQLDAVGVVKRIARSCPGPDGGPVRQ